MSIAVKELEDSARTKPLDWLNYVGSRCRYNTVVFKNNGARREREHFRNHHDEK